MCRNEVSQGDRAEGPSRGLQVMPSVAMGGLFGIAVLFTLYFAKAVLLPVALAVVLSLALMPWLHGLRRLGSPRPLAAGLLVSGVVAVAATTAIQLSEPAAKWIARAPDTLSQVEHKLRGVRRSVADATKAAQKMDELTRAVTATPTPKLAVAEPGIAERLISQAPQLAASTAAVLILTYFLLAKGDLLLRKLVGAGADFRRLRHAVIMTRRVQSEVAGYLFLIAAINTGLAVVTATMMALLGMPNPVLWGVMAGILNFIPYLGPAASLAVIATVSVLSFDAPIDMLLPPLLFALLAFIEGQLVSPALIGRRFTLNPVVVVLATMLWGWLWGIAGALIAVPLLVTLRVAGEHVTALKPFAAVIADAEPGEAPPDTAGDAADTQAATILPAN